MDTQIFTASEARKHLYDLIESAAKGLRTYEITKRGSNDSVVLISKSELESWQETLDILSSRQESNTIRIARRQKRTISHKSLLKAIGLVYEPILKKRLFK